MSARHVLVSAPSESSSNELFVAKNVSKSFQVEKQTVSVLHDVSLSISTGEFMTFFGPSGSGKSTMLHTLIGLEAPTTGAVFYNGINMYTQLSEEDRAQQRKKSMGIMYQHSHWVHSLNVLNNTALPLLILGCDRAYARSRAAEMLEFVQMGEWFTQSPLSLSAGQQQRVALARALVHSPKVVVTDEPTGNLDYKSGLEILTILRALNQQHKTTILMVTHDMQHLKYADRIVSIADGSVRKIYTKKNVDELISLVVEEAKK